MTTLVATWRAVGFNTSWLRTAWALSALIVLLIAIFDWSGLAERVTFALGALAHTAPFVAFAVIAIGWLKASEAEGLVAAAFQGRESRMIVLAALVGGLAPFCSCEVIPFVAALLIAGTPLSAVMAFWLASPLMDPPAFAITVGALGWEYAIGKTIAAVTIGLLGGFTLKLMVARGAFADPLRSRDSAGSCCGSPKRDPQLRGWFWPEPQRRAVFWDAASTNALFLLKWLMLAYLIESAMIAYVPAEAIASVVGGEGLGSIFIGALVGIPAYLNGYAAPPLVSGLMAQGMTPGAAMSFMVAGGMTCIPAMAAVFALVKRDVFATYLAFAFVGAILSGIAFSGWIAFSA